MKWMVLAILLVGLSIASDAQNLNTYETSTDKHVIIRGTNIAMIPPTSYVLSEEFKGFHNPDDQTSMIMVMETPQSYFDVAAGFTREQLMDQGLVLTSLNTVNVNGYDGSLIELVQVANNLIYAKSILIYGDSSSSSMINGVYLKEMTALGEMIMDCIKSTIVNTGIVLDPRGDLDYNLNELAGNLKFHSVVGKTMLFSRDGMIPTESKERLILATDKSFAKDEIKDKREFCIARVKTYPNEFQIIMSQGVNEIELDGMRGYGLYALNGTSEEKEMYQAIVFDESDGYYVFVGSFLKGDEKAKSDILKVIETFKRDLD